MPRKSYSLQPERGKITSFTHAIKPDNQRVLFVLLCWLKSCILHRNIIIDFFTESKIVNDWADISS